VVDGLERELRGRVAFVKVNVTDDRGADIALRYGIHGVPAFIVLDGNGRMIYRQVGGRPDREAVLARLPR
jgi:thioredoxin-like negative regulator of GroEL